MIYATYGQTGECGACVPACCSLQSMISDCHQSTLYNTTPHPPPPSTPPQPPGGETTWGGGSALPSCPSQPNPLFLNTKKWHTTQDRCSHLPPTHEAVPQQSTAPPQPGPPTANLEHKIFEQQVSQAYLHLEHAQKRLRGDTCTGVGSGRKGLRIQLCCGGVQHRGKGTVRSFYAEVGQRRLHWVGSKSSSPGGTSHSSRRSACCFCHACFRCLRCRERLC